MFSIVSPEKRIPADHPLRRIKAMADEVLTSLSTTFDAVYSSVRRPSIPPERLLKSQILGGEDNQAAFCGRARGVVTSCGHEPVGDAEGEPLRVT